MASDRLQRRAHARVAGRQEADEWNEEGAGVELACAIALHKGTELGVIGTLTHFLVNLIAELAPTLERPLQLKVLDAFDGAVEGDPGHDLGVREVTRTSTHLPQALVGLMPNGLEMLEQLQLQVPFGGLGRQAARAALKQGIHDL